MKAVMYTFSNELFVKTGHCLEPIDLPDDLTVMPVRPRPDIYADEDQPECCHSESTREWYIITNAHSDTLKVFPDLKRKICFRGSWTYIAPYLSLNHIYAPFKWGESIVSEKCKYLHYIPFWESVPDDKDKEGFTVYKEVYKVMTVIVPSFDGSTPGNYCSYNSSTDFSIREFDDIVQLAKFLESVGRIKRF